MDDSIETPISIADNYLNINLTIKLLNEIKELFRQPLLKNKMEKFITDVFDGAESKHRF